MLPETGERHGMISNEKCAFTDDLLVFRASDAAALTGAFSD